MQSKEGFLKDKFNTETFEPAADVWKNIAANLDNEKRKKRALIWWFSGLAAGLVAVFFLWPFDYSSSTVITEKKASITANLNPFIGTHYSGEFLEEAIRSNKDTIQPFCADFYWLDFSWKDVMFFNHYQMPTCNVQMPNDPLYNLQYMEYRALLNPIVNQMPKPELALLTAINDKRVETPIPIPVEKKFSKAKWYKEISLGYGRFIQTNSNADLGESLTNDTSTFIGPLGLDANYAENIRTFSQPLAVNFIVGQKFSKRWEMRLGLGVMYYQERIVALSALKEKNEYLSLNVPLSMRYNFISRKRSKVFAELGCDVNIPVYERKTVYSGTANTNKGFITGIQPLAKMNLGYTYALNDRNSVTLMPELRYALTKTNPVYSNAFQPKWFLGIALGFRF